MVEEARRERLGEVATGLAPVVSVVVRTKDRPGLLAEALASVAAQSLRPLEAVVVNDGGSDVRTLAREAAGRLPITLVTLQPGRGRAAAGNAGIAAALAPWLLFLDDDDLLLPGALEGLVTAASAATPAIVYGIVEAVRYPGLDAAARGTPWRRFAVPFDPTGLLFENFIPFNAALLPSEAVRQVGGLDESLECFEDWDLFLRLSDRMPLAHVEVPVAEYRVLGTAFVDGRGGEERQLQGRAAIMEKHAARYAPVALAAMTHWAKRHLLERETAQLLAPLTQRVAALEAERDLLAGALASLDLPSVSVVIVTLDGRHHLERCLVALFRSEGVTVEVIVVDNGSTDGTVEWLRRAWPRVRVVPLGKNLGFGEANRRGVALASSGWVALLNNDTEVEPGWLQALLLPMLADPGLAAACSVLELMDAPGILNARGGGMSWLGYGFDRDFGISTAALTGAPAQEPVIFPTAAAMLMRRDAFEAVGGFDRAFFMYHEDVDLGWRWWLAGWRVAVVRDSRVRHAYGGTSSSRNGLAWRNRLGMRHNVRTLLKCFGPGMLLGALRRITRLWWQRRAFREAAAVTAWNLLHLPGTLAARVRIQRRRTLSDSALFAAGLIAPSPTPPPPPDRPRRARWHDVTELVPSSVLLPGQTSALGRLGPGWHAREKATGGWCRHTAPLAAAVMRVRSGARGQLVLGLRGAAPGQRVVVGCNGASVEAVVGACERKLSLPVVAGEDGALHIEIRSTPVVPHDRSGNWDFRKLGVAVSSIELEEDEPVAPLPIARVSVVIPTFNRRAILQETLEALTAQSHPPVEVVVVDDGSTDGTSELLGAWVSGHATGPRVVALRQDNAGPGRARNLGVRQATGDLVLFLGDDTIPASNLVAEHARAHREHPGPAAVLGFTDWDRQRMRVTPLLEMVNREGYQFGYGLLTDGEEAPFTCFYTSNISVPRELLGREPFHPAFAALDWEDTELGYRLNLAGVPVVYNARARARHLHQLDANKLVRRQRRVGSRVGVLLRLHPELINDQTLGLAAPPAWLWLARLVLPPLVPILGGWDRLGLRLPGWLWHRVLSSAFHAGRQDAGRPRG